MNATLSLPLVDVPPSTPRNLNIHPATAPASPGLPRVERIVRKGPLLHTGPGPDNDDVLSLNLAQGCAHRCAFCSVRASPSYRGDDTIFLVANTAERLRAELTSRRHRPRAVYVSPSTDPFMPLAEVQAETVRIVEVLAEHGVEAWLMTRGYIRPGVLEVLAEHRQHVKVTVGITTLDRSLARVLEPLAAPPRLRLRQIGQLRERGVSVGVQVAPLVPGLTDTRSNLESLVDALASVGVKRVSAGYLFLRSGIRDNLDRAFAAHGLDPSLLDEFADGPILTADGVAAACYLPKARRQRGYAALMALAARRNMSVSVCGLTNPDFGTPKKAAVGEVRTLPLR